MTQWLKFARSIVLRLQNYLFLRCLSSCHSTCHSSLASSAGNLRRVATTRDLWKRHVDTFHLQTPHVAHPKKNKQSLICFSQILSKWWIIKSSDQSSKISQSPEVFFSPWILHPLDSQGDLYPEADVPYVRTAEPGDGCYTETLRKLCWNPLF